MSQDSEQDEQSQYVSYGKIEINLLMGPDGDMLIAHSVTGVDVQSTIVGVLEMVKAAVLNPSDEDGEDGPW